MPLFCFTLVFGVVDDIL